MTGTADEARGSADQSEPVRRPRRLHLELPDPWDSVAGEDRPESWGDSGPDERRRLAEYEENRPPHHL